MESIIKVAVLAAVGASVGLAIKKSNADLAILLTIALACVILGFAMEALSEIADFMRETAEAAGVSSSVLTIVLKVTGIAITTNLASDVFRDAQQTSAASAAQLCGTCAALCTAIPLMRAVFEMINGLI